MTESQPNKKDSLLQALIRIVLIIGLAFGGAFVWSMIQYMEQIETPIIFAIVGVYAFISINYAMIREIIK
jgi:hypothetical protein